MDNFIPTQLRFPSSAGFTVRADFDGGEISSDFGALRLRGTDLRVGLIPRLVSAIYDTRHASYIDHSLADLLRQRIFQTACGYADGNDANTLRRDSMFKLAAGRAPLSEGNDLASGATFSRLENRVSRKDIYRLAQSFVDAFIASYAQAPAAIVLDRDHSEDTTHGQQELAFYNHHYGNYCYLPLFLFEGLSGVIAKAEVMAPGDNPRYVVTSLADPTPDVLYKERYCARGQGENFIKAVKNDLASDLTSVHAFLANHLRLFYSCAAYTLIRSLREHTLVHTELAKAQPVSIILKLFKRAVRVVQYKDRIKLSLPTSCPMKGILARVTELLYFAPRSPAPA